MDIKSVIVGALLTTSIIFGMGLAVDEPKIKLIDIEELEKKLLKVFDKNGNGKLDEDEFPPFKQMHVFLQNLIKRYSAENVNDEDKKPKVVPNSGSGGWDYGQRWRVKSVDSTFLNLSEKNADTPDLKMLKKEAERSIVGWELFAIQGKNILFRQHAR